MDSSCSAVLGFLCRNFPFMMHQMSSAGKGSRLFHYKATLLQQMQYCLTEICKPVPEKDLQLPFCTDCGPQKHQCKPLMQAFQLRIVPVLNAPESLKIRHPIVMFSLVICPRDLSTFSLSFDDIMYYRWWDILIFYNLYIDGHYSVFQKCVDVFVFLQIGEPLPIFTSEKLRLLGLGLCDLQINAFCYLFTNTSAQLFLELEL